MSGDKKPAMVKHIFWTDTRYTEDSTDEWPFLIIMRMDCGAEYTIQRFHKTATKEEVQEYVDDQKAVLGVQ